MNKRFSIIKYLVIGIMLVTGIFFTACDNKDKEPKDKVYANYEIVDAGSLYSYEIDNAVSKIESYFRLKGYTYFSVERYDDANIRVVLPESDATNDTFYLLEKSAKIEFRVEGQVIATSADLIGAQAENMGREWGVKVTFNSQGATKFAEATDAHVGENLYIYVIFGSEENLIESATINEQISGGVAIISGGLYPEREANRLADQISVGAFGITLKLQNIGKIV